MKKSILDYIDFDEVNKLLEGFNQTTGFVTAILDLEGNILSKSGWRPICTQFHRIHPESSKNCTSSDTVLANELGNGEKYHFYKCLNGLIDVAVPIYIKGEHIANLFSGQFFFEAPDPEYFKNQAEKYNYNPDEYFRALKDVPVVSKEKVKIAMDFLLNMTQLISNMTYQKLEQAQLNKALQKSEVRLRSAFDQMLEGCQILGFDWKYIYLNQVAETHNRRPNQELIGRRYQDMWPGIEQTTVFGIIQRVLETRISHHFENEFTYPNGSNGWFDLNIQAIEDGVLILSIDITERKKVESALLESEEKYRLLADHSGDWIYWRTQNGEMKYVSPACEKITEYTAEEFTRNPDLLHEIVHEADKELFAKHAGLFQQEDSCQGIEFRIKTKTGETRWINHSCSPIFGKTGEFLGRRGTNRNITDQKIKEEQLFESELRFSRLFENGPFGVVMADKQFRFRKANQAFCRIVQYSAEELLNFTFKDISHPDDLPKDLENVQKLMDKEISVYRTEKRYFRKDGTMIWGSLTLSATYNSEGEFLYNLGIVEDISERKRHEEEIRQLNERISTATRASKVGIWDWDVQNNILKWDDQMYSLYGLKKSEFSGAYEAWAKGLHPEDKEFSMKQTELALIGAKEYDAEFRIIWPDGSIHHIAAKGEVFRNESGEPIRMIGINLDISEQKQSEESLRESEERYRKLNESLEERVAERTAQLKAANIELEAFSYSVSHDLRAPLRHINGYVDLLNDRFVEELPEKARHYLATISNSAKQMGNLIDDLLQFSRTGRKELSQALLEMNNLIKEVLDKIQPDIKNRKIKWSIEPLPSIYGDYSMMKQVWINLIDNAVKYTRYKEIAEITIESRTEKNHVQFSIRDNGVGFDMKYAGKLFGVFQRLHSQSEFEGTGIGLANVQRIIHKHNGRVWAEAELGTGATFYFSLPLKT